MEDLFLKIYLIINDAIFAGILIYIFIYSSKLDLAKEIKQSNEDKTS
ncbi:hypothetical protein QQ008_04755 [Fulvivirgaceae bacterium BMA10]|uniref:Uncharacterized protein n=1 Tax=Splendidivirga corallicola TaxID=3051826 RepID=A0ABT8KK88_9BACT|nr:hypothetical protein [Fulvivirgaceae bacterium BMA10]